MNTAGTRRIRYISQPAPVSMGNSWYAVSDTSHFWVQRRFEVLRHLNSGIIPQATRIAEVGCGHGLVQRQIEDYYNREVTGFDLNEMALKHTVSRTSPVCCYNVFDKDSAYQGHFDLILLFDVLEHLRDEDTFLTAVRFHLAPTGKILINVPACQFLWSKYDVADGHFRRYTINSLQRTSQRNGMTVKTWSYWCLPLVPLLILRKLWMFTQSDDEAVAAGFDSRGRLVNRLLLSLSRCEPIPQQLLGTSLMAILEPAF